MQNNTLNDFLSVKSSMLINSFVIIIMLFTVFVSIKIPFRTKLDIIIKYYSVICKLLYFHSGKMYEILCLLVKKGILQNNKWKCVLCTYLQHYSMWIIVFSFFFSGFVNNISKKNFKRIKIKALENIPVHEMKTWKIRKEIKNLILFEIALQRTNNKLFLESVTPSVIYIKVLFKQMGPFPEFEFSISL